MSGTRNPRAIAAAGGIAALLLGTASTPAMAEQWEREQFHDVGSEVIDDCGLMLRHEWDVSGSFVLNSRGPDGLAYGVETVHGTDAVTNLANGKTLTQIFNVASKDQQVTDNGDGTLTLLVLATGSGKVYGPDGKLLLSDPGQTRYELLIDTGGTPTDPTDDEFLQFLGVVFGSTGRNDLQGRDYCADLQAFIG